MYFFLKSKFYFVVLLFNFFYFRVLEYSGQDYKILSVFITLGEFLDTTFFRFCSLVLGLYTFTIL